MQKQYKTADGFTFTLQSDGTLTDGDMVFDSLDELKKHANVQEIETPYTWHIDGGHEWLEVTQPELERLNGLEYYSGFSYRDGNRIFLEGDCDAPKFLQAKKFCGEKVSFTEKHYSGDAPLRQFEKLHAATETRAMIGEAVNILRELKAAR